jgi:Cu/Ag efflux pump CusA
VVIGPAADFRVNLTAAARAGFSAEEVANMQAAMLDGVRPSETIIANRLYGIRVRYPEAYRSRVDQLGSKSIATTSRKPL